MTFPTSLTTSASLNPLEVRDQFWTALGKEKPPRAVTMQDVAAYLPMASPGDALSWAFLRALQAGRVSEFDWRVGTVNPFFRQKPFEVLEQALEAFFDRHPDIRTQDLRSATVPIPIGLSETLSLKLNRAIDLYWPTYRQQLIEEGVLDEQAVPRQPVNEEVVNILYYKLTGKVRWDPHWGRKTREDHVLALPWKKTDFWPSIHIHANMKTAEVRTQLASVLALLREIRKQDQIRQDKTFVGSTNARHFFYYRGTGQVVNLRTLLCQFNYLLVQAHQRKIDTVAGFDVDFRRDVLVPDLNMYSKGVTFPSATIRKNLWDAFSRLDDPECVAVSKAASQAPGLVVRRRPASGEVKVLSEVVPETAPIPVRGLKLSCSMPDLGDLDSLEQIFGELAQVWPKREDGLMDFSLLRRPIHLSLALHFTNGQTTLERLLRNHRKLFENPQQRAEREALNFLPDNPDTHLYLLWALSRGAQQELSASSVKIPANIIHATSDFDSLSKLMKEVIVQCDKEGMPFDVDLIQHGLVVLSDKRSRTLASLAYEFWCPLRLKLIKSGKIPASTPARVSNETIVGLIRQATVLKPIKHLKKGQHPVLPWPVPQAPLAAAASPIQSTPGFQKRALSVVHGVAHPGNLALVLKTASVGRIVVANGIFSKPAFIPNR